MLRDYLLAHYLLLLDRQILTAELPEQYDLQPKKTWSCAQRARPLGAPRLVLYRMQVLFLANTASPLWQIPTQYSRLDHDEISVRKL
jgi:hypothetical protein